MIPFQLVLWILQAVAAISVIIGGVNATDAGYAFSDTGETSFFDVFSTIGPFLIAAACWFAQWWVGKTFGLNSEIYQAVVAFLASPSDPATRRRLLTAVIEWLASQNKDKPAVLAKINELSEMLTPRWAPTVIDNTPKV